MAYCTVGDVQSYLTYVTLSDTSHPTKEQVSKLCDDASDNIIDPIIRKFIDLPLTDSIGLAYLKQGAIYFVVTSVMRSLGEVGDVLIRLEEQYNLFLTNLKTNNAILTKPNSNYPKTAYNTAREPKYNLDYSEDLW